MRVTPEAAGADPFAGRPAIGVTGTPGEDGAECRVRSSYIEALEASGAAPVLFPSLVEPARRAGWLRTVDGLLLTGGPDVHPSLYGEEILDETVKTDVARDQLELPLVREALEAGLPVLAICRGIQVLNVALGGSLYQDLPRQAPSAIDHRQAKKTSEQERSEWSHTIRIRPGSHLERVAGASMVRVNSFHHQAIRRLAPGLEAVAWAEDDIIEAVELCGSAFVIGVQFHPEDMTATQPHARRLFDAFVEAARSWRAALHAAE